MREESSSTYEITALPAGSGPNTGIAFLNILAQSPILQTLYSVREPQSRPAIIVSCGRHSLAMCYMQFPDPNSTTGFLDMIPICEGNFTNVSVIGPDNNNHRLVLFSGGSGSGNVTPSQIFKIIVESQSATTVWVDTNTQIARNGCFAQSTNGDFVLAGYSVDPDNGNQVSDTCYYEFLSESWCSYSDNDNDNDNKFQWKLRWSLKVPHPLGPVAVGVSSNRRTTVVVGCYVGSIIGCPLTAYYNDDDDFTFVGVDDFVFIGGGEAGVRAQSFLLTRKADDKMTLTRSYRRIPLGPVTDGRNVAVADFTGNGLPDIFLLCVSDPHLLILQTAPGVFAPPLCIANSTAEAGGEARGIAVGRLYGRTDSLEVWWASYIVFCGMQLSP
eukprot:gene26631-34885_t